MQIFYLFSLKSIFKRGCLLLVALVFVGASQVNGNAGKPSVVKDKLFAGNIVASPTQLYDNDVAGGAAGINRTITIQNTSTTGSLTLSGISLSGANASQFVLGSLPSFPNVLAPQGIVTFTVAFDPASTGLKTASLDIASDDASQPTLSVPLRGLGTAGLGGTNEPSLQALMDLYQIPVSVGDDNAATNIINSNTTLQKAAILGDEVSLQKFIKAGPGLVTVEPLAVFGPTTSDPVVGAGWYLSGNSATQEELFTVSNAPASNGQTVNVNFTGTLSFDPGNVSFGFYSRWPFFSNRHLYSEDDLNTFSGAIPHHVRVYPYKDTTGAAVPFAYVVAFEENTSGFDYQDIIFIVRNVTTASTLPVQERVPTQTTTLYRSVKIYPNPLRGAFTLELSAKYKGAVTLQLVTTAGQVYDLGKANVQSNGARLDLDVSKLGLAPGMHFLKVHAENGKAELFKLLLQ